MIWGPEALPGFMCPTSRQNLYSHTTPSYSPRLSDMNPLVPIQPTALPRRLGRAAIEKLLIKILQSQDIFARYSWEMYNSLGYRLDKEELERGKDRDRIWKLEHPEAYDPEANEGRGTPKGGKVIHRGMTG